MKKSYFFTTVMLLAFSFVFNATLFARTIPIKDKPLFGLTTIPPFGFALSVDKIAAKTINYAYWNSPNPTNIQNPCSMANNYIFSTETHVELEKFSDGITIIENGNDEELRDISFDKIAPAFSFKYLGADITGLTITDNGLLILNSEGSLKNFDSHPQNDTESEDVTNALFPFWDDLATGNNGSVKYKVVGTAPNRKFVVEWKTKLHTDNNDLFYNFTFQVWLHETSNVIQYVYGENRNYVIPDNDLPNPSFSATIGIKGAQGEYNVVSSSHTNSTIAINDNYSVWPGAGTSYIFTPAVETDLVPTFDSVAAICSGATLSDLSTTSNNGVEGSWLPELNNTETTEYTFTPNEGICATTATMTIKVYTTAPPTGAASQSFCAINTPKVVNLFAQGKGDIVWYATAESTTPLLATQSLTSKDYFATESNGSCESVSRLKVAVTVSDPLAPSGNAMQSFCAINTPTVANLSATGKGIVWYDTATGSTALPNTSLLKNGIYYATQKIGTCESDTRLKVTVTVADPLAPSGTASQSFCAINNPRVANLSATGTGIVWYDTETGTTPLLKTTLLASGTYYASQTIGTCESDTRLTVAVTVADPSVPNGDDSQSFCAINTPKVTNLSAAGTGVVWYGSLTSTTPLSNTSLLVSKNYYATQKEGTCMSSTRLVVAVTVSDPMAPTGAVAQSFCAINNPTVENLVATGTGIVWYATLLGTTPLSRNDLLATKFYYATQNISGCESDTRLIVYVTVSDPFAPTGPLSQSFCAITNPMVSNLSFNGTGIVWYETQTGTTPLSKDALLINGAAYYAIQTVGTCVSDTRLRVAVRIAKPIAPTGNAAQSFCAINKPMVSNLSATGIGIVWYATETGTTPLSRTTLLASGTYYATQTVVSCASDTRLRVAVTVNNPDAPTGSATQSFCTINSPKLANLSATGTGIVWYSTLTSTTPLLKTTLLLSKNYYASQTVSGCVSTARLLVTVTLNKSVSGTVSADQLISAGSAPANITLTNSVGLIQWQSSTDNSNFVNISDATNPTLTATEIGVLMAKRYFRAVLQDGTCALATSRVVMVNLTAIAAKTAAIILKKSANAVGSSVVSNVVNNSSYSNSIAVNVYPNPYSSSFKLNFSSSSQSNVEVSVYDMIGRHIENRQVKSSEINNLELGSDYPTGVYNVIVTQGTEVKTLRVIKK